MLAAQSRSSFWTWTRNQLHFSSDIEPPSTRPGHAQKGSQLSHACNWPSLADWARLCNLGSLSSCSVNSMGCLAGFTIVTDYSCACVWLRQATGSTKSSRRSRPVGKVHTRLFPEAVDRNVLLLPCCPLRNQSRRIPGHRPPADHLPGRAAWLRKLWPKACSAHLPLPKYREGDGACHGSSGSNRYAPGLCRRFAASFGSSWSFVPWSKELGEHLYRRGQVCTLALGPPVPVFADALVFVVKWLSFVSFRRLYLRACMCRSDLISAPVATSNTTLARAGGMHWKCLPSFHFFLGLLAFHESSTQLELLDLRSDISSQGKERMVAAFACRSNICLANALKSSKFAVHPSLSGRVFPKASPDRDSRADSSEMSCGRVGALRSGLTQPARQLEAPGRQARSEAPRRRKERRSLCRSSSKLASASRSDSLVNTKTRISCDCDGDP